MIPRIIILQINSGRKEDRDQLKDNPNSTPEVKDTDTTLNYKGHLLEFNGNLWTHAIMSSSLEESLNIVKVTALLPNLLIEKEL